MFDQFIKGHRDPDFLNFMLKVKRRCELWDFPYFRNMNLDPWREGLGLLTFVVVCHFISRFLRSSDLFRSIRCSCLLLGS
jgi:hypothetical protein